VNQVIDERTQQSDDVTVLADELRPLLAQLTLMLRREAGHLQVSPSQSTVLGVLRSGPRRMSDLTAYVGVKGPSMTVLVDRMERDGWVKRSPDPDDRRAVRVEITPSGLAVADDVRAAWSASLAQHLASLSRQERAAITTALPALWALVER
jgi:DNA-binding MarR family transcriptional regulator